MIRVLVVDDHAAIRAGLHALLRLEPGIVPVDVVSTGAEAVERARRGDVTVALLDFHLPDTNGIALSRELQKLPEPPAILLYSAFADDHLALPAILVGVRRVLPKSASADQLFEAIRESARDRHAPRTAPDAALLRAARGRVSLEDLPLLGMAADGTPAPEIGRVLGLPADEVESRLERIVEDLTAGIGDAMPEPATARSVPA